MPLVLNRIDAPCRLLMSSVRTFTLRCDSVTPEKKSGWRRMTSPVCFMRTEQSALSVVFEYTVRQGITGKHRIFE